MWSTTNSAYGSGVETRRIPIEGPEKERGSVETRDDSMIALALAQEELKESGLGDEMTRDDSMIALALEGQSRDDAAAREVAEGRLSLTQSLMRRISSERGASEQLEPKTVEAVPEAEVVTEHRERLQRHLRDFDLTEHHVQGDGACQFRALAHQLFGDEERHGVVRAKVVSQLRAERDRYEPFVMDSTFDEFLTKMARASEWGDHLTLQAAADVYQTRVCLVTSYERPFVHVQPTGWAEHDPLLQQRPTIWLSFWAEVHYNSLASYSDPDAREGQAQHFTPALVNL